MKAGKLIVLVLLIGVAVYFSLHFFRKKEDSVSLTINNKTVVLEVAKTEQQREHGLMDRQFMPKDHGMIFLFHQPQRLHFWMKNTLIPLDMIFLNHHTVVALLNNVPPCKQANCPSYSPDVQADTVIELNAGVAKQLMIQIGNTFIK